MGLRKSATLSRPSGRSARLTVALFRSIGKQLLPPFQEYLEGGQIYVEPPTQLIFLGGGKTKQSAKRLLSIRDAFLKIPENPALKSRSILLAERVNTFHLSRPAYSNLLAFEIDFAQLCELILLFSESQGSI